MKLKTQSIPKIYLTKSKEMIDDMTDSHTKLLKSGKLKFIDVIYQCFFPLLNPITPTKAHNILNTFSETLIARLF